MKKLQVVDPLHPNHRPSMTDYSASNWLKDVPRVVVKLIEKSDWKDLDPGRRTVLNFRYLDDDDIVQLGAKVFDSLKITVTDSAATNLMLLAYNLKDSKGLRCFEKVPSELEDPKRLIEFDEIVHLHAADNKTHNEKMAVGFCYLAASYMSLFTTSVEKYMRIQTRHQTKFVSFYGFSFPFASYHLPLESMKALKKHLDPNSLLKKNTLYNLLYAGEMTPVGKDLKDFLYVTHTSYTGLHPYKLFCQIMDALNVTNTYLCAIMRSKELDRELNSLSGIFTNLKGNQHKDYKCQMWRFGRILDPTFLSSLQAKEATFFIAVCANILNIISEESNRNILSMGHIADMQESMKKRARSYALKILEIHQRKQTEGNVQQLYEHPDGDVEEKPKLDIAKGSSLRKAPADSTGRGGGGSGGTKRKR